MQAGVVAAITVCERIVIFEDGEKVAEPSW